MQATIVEAAIDSNRRELTPLFQPVARGAATDKTSLFRLVLRCQSTLRQAWLERNIVADARRPSKNGAA